MINEIVKKYNLDYFETDEELRGFVQRYFDVQYSGKFNMLTEASSVLECMHMPTDKDAQNAYFGFVFNYEDILKDLGLCK